MAQRLQKKSNWGLLAMLVLALAIVAFMIWWPTPASEEPQQPATEQAQPAPAAEKERPTPEQATIIKEGAVAPDFEVTMFDGEKVRLADLKGKVVLLNFWATWCPPCRAELARVEKDIIKRFEGKPFVFLPVSRGEERKTVAEFREKMGYTFPMGLDTDSSIYKKYAETYIPRNFLINKEGKVVKASVGYDEAEFAELIKQIEETIKK
ncbi:MAG: TlpA family protein disulfide reductase [Alistipes sp.]|nr:TlpA family protein disulfide reductase [Alistipes sp.]